MDRKIYVGLTKKQTGALPKKGRAEVPVKGKKAVKVVPYEYRTPLACPANTDPEGSEVGCENAYSGCAEVDDANGPLVWIFRRPVLPGKKKADWSNVGATCWPELVPNAKSKPRLTLAMIKAEFVRTPFTKPTVSVQPVGNRTLVNLPTYFAAGFAGPGYGPDEVRTVTILGHKVQIKPILKTNTYHFGDGTDLGPTRSRGGPYPGGDVRHTYDQRGTVNTSVTTVYGGQFAVDGGAFTDLPGTATINGPAQRIQILEATGRLVR